MSLSPLTPLPPHLRPPLPHLRSPLPACELPPPRLRPPSPPAPSPLPQRECRQAPRVTESVNLRLCGTKRRPERCMATIRHSERKSTAAVQDPGPARVLHSTNEA